MKLSEINPEDITVDQAELVRRILFHGTEDDGLNGDLIMVFGSMNATKYRVPLAVELYNNGRAPLLLMSGGKSEAEAMKAKAVELGVPAGRILMETRSSNTGENVTESKRLLEEQIGLSRIRRILIVTTHYHMRRCYLTLKTHMPAHIEYTCCPADDTVTRKDNWWTNEIGTARVLKEIKGLVRYIREGKIADFEIGIER